MKNIIDLNYKSILDRGLITTSTTLLEFTDKLQEEVQEFLNYSDQENFREELADIILVCFNIAKHYNIDIEREIKSKISVNIERSEDNTQTTIFDLGA
jgi:NTP pyrophosphatase (non-canonical NTP hydrolase)